MELQFYGANCLKITTKKSTIVIDDNLSDIGKKSITKLEDIILITNQKAVNALANKIVLNYPAEYEVGDVSIQGIAARSHLDSEAEGQSSTIFKISTSDVRLLILGHIYPDLNEQQLEAIGTVDVLCIPVGGNGFTLDALGALKCIKKIEPKIIIPTHYSVKGINYEVPQATLEEVVKDLSMELSAPIERLKIKSADFGEASGLVVLEVSN